MISKAISLSLSLSLTCFGSEEHGTDGTAGLAPWWAEDATAALHFLLKVIRAVVLLSHWVTNFVIQRLEF